MHAKDLDIPYLIITATHSTITSKRGSPPSFANLHPKIFAHLDINLKDKQKDKVKGKFD